MNINWLITAGGKLATKWRRYRREKEIRRLNRQYMKELAAKKATALAASPASATASTLPVDVRPATPWAIYSVLALAGIASLGMIVYGSSLFSRTSTSSLATTAAIAAGVLTLTIMLAAYLTYLNKNGPIRWRQPVVPVPTPTPAPATPATGAAPPTPPPPSSSFNWKWVWGLVGLIICVVGVVGIIKFWSWSSTPGTQTAAATTTIASNSILEREVAFGKKWSEEVRVPMGYHVSWESVEPVVYEVKTQTGKIYKLPLELEPGVEEYTEIKGRLSRLQFRIYETESRDYATVKVRFKPLH